LICFSLKLYHVVLFSLEAVKSWGKKVC